MKYRIVKTNNKNKVKLVLEAASFDSILTEYRHMLTNNKVDLPKKYINKGEIKPLETELLLLKERVSTDTNRIIRDKMGRTIEERSDSDKWVILDSNIYYEEESFYVFGYDSKLNRFTVRDIIKKILMNGIKSKTATKQIIMVNNKLIIRGDDMDIIICKCKDDCVRLYHKLKDISLNSNINRLIFMGHVSKTMKKELYVAILIKTGWNKDKLWRTSTRP